MSGTSGEAVASGAELDIRKRGFGALVQVAAWPGTGASVTEALRSLGIDLPTVPGQVRDSTGGVAMALAPGRWLVETPGDPPEKIPAEIGAITDLTHARESFHVRGRQALDLVSKIAPVDFGLPRHGAGSVVQTGSGHSTPFTLWHQEPDVFVVYVERSYAADFAHGLAAEAEEFVGR